jgi:hypothetical protein
MEPDIEANLATAERLMAEAAGKGADCGLPRGAPVALLCQSTRDTDQPGVADRYAMADDHPALARLSELASDPQAGHHRQCLPPGRGWHIAMTPARSLTPMGASSARPTWSMWPSSKAFWEKDYYAHGAGV